MKNNEIIKALNDIDELFKNRRILKQNNPSMENVPVDINLKIIRNKKSLEAAYGVYDEVRKEIMSQIEGISMDNMEALTPEERKRVKSADKQIGELLAAGNPVTLEMIGEKDIERSNLDIEELAALSFMIYLAESNLNVDVDEKKLNDTIVDQINEHTRQTGVCETQI